MKSSVELNLRLWVPGWLFTIGFSDLSFWQGFLAIVIWPYYLGSTMVHIL